MGKIDTASVKNQCNKRNYTLEFIVESNKYPVWIRFVLFSVKRRRNIILNAS